MGIQAVQEESVQADYDERRPSQSLLILGENQLRMVCGLWRLHRVVSSFDAGSLYCMHAALAFQLVTEDELTTPSTALCILHGALRVISPLERELFISAERQNFVVVCRGDPFS